MKKNILTQYFEEIETAREYNGYFCSAAEAVTIVIPGSICGLKNISQIHQWAASDRINGLLKEKRYSFKLISVHFYGKISGYN